MSVDELLARVQATATIFEIIYSNPDLMPALRCFIGYLPGWRPGVSAYRYGIAEIEAGLGQLVIRTELYPVHLVAIVLCVEPATVKRLIRNERLPPACRAGKYTYITRDALDAEIVRRLMPRINGKRPPIGEEQVHPLWFL